MDLQKLQDYLQSFANERNWHQYHTPKNLSMALAAECGELLEIFQWLDADESTTRDLGPKNRQNAKEELADIFIYTIRLASVLEIDLEQAFWEKMKKNAIKYPPESEKTRYDSFNK